MSQWCPNGGPAISDVASRSPSRKAYLKASRSVSRNQGGFLENSPADFPEGFPEKWPEGFLDNFSECLPEGFPGAFLEGLSEGLPECFLKLLSEGLPESGGFRFPADFPEGQSKSGDVCTIPPITRNVGMEGSRVFLRTPPSRHIEGHDIS